MTTASKQEIIDRARNESRTLLTEVESKELIARAGIDVIDTRHAVSRDEAISISQQLGFPVALKIASPDIIHKNDTGGVKLGLKTASQAGKAYDEILKTAAQKHPGAKIQGISVQKMARPGIEVVIGMSKDAQFGPMLMFGLGGIWVEVLKDVSFRLAPITERDAGEMVREIKSYPLLSGYREHEPVDTAKLEDFLLKISHFVTQNPYIKELDLNPIFAYHNGAVAVDARIILEEEES
jgi:acyl-CoA synthetase (NDP forming)